ncbi:MAG: outer membrane protein assembly factor BamA, partial [Pseudomonadota bacterium]|nr:outer membrane protein assembly factor BamA [Pseudomonadota bacterium]
MRPSIQMRLILSLSVFCWLATAQAFEAFMIKDIRLEGLQRIAAGTVFNYLPVQVGDVVDTQATQEAISALFKTGLFKNIVLKRDDAVLIIVVEEQPTIAQITLTGNRAIDSEQLLQALKPLDFAEGRLFNQSLLDKVELELQRQYFNLGQYAVHIQTTVTPLDRNRVGIQIDISEGKVARIHRITLVGNQAFSERTLLAEMSLSATNWLSFFTQDDHYGQQKLAADLETLRSYYLDRGYINFNLESTQVAISPDKKNIYITINLNEGKRYTLSDIKLVGNLIVPQAELLSQIKLKPTHIFSRKQVTQSTETLSERLGQEGYAFAHINAIPDIDPKTQTVALTFFIDPGKRIYVRRLQFYGNIRTRDDVLRREMRQMEGGWLSTQAVKRSLERLERLDYFETVEVETPIVAESPDQVDLNYRVIEKPSGNLLAGVGYSQTQGILFNASLFQDNFLGTGKRIGVTFNNSQVNTVYNFSYFNPYINLNGVSRGFNLFYRTTDAERANLSRYTTDIYGAGIKYGLPLSEFNDIHLGLAFDDTTLKTTASSAREVFNFIEHNGDHYASYRATASWAYDSRNRVLLPDRGLLHAFGAETTLPLSDLNYYKVNYRFHWLYPLIKDYIFSLETQIAYGDGYLEDDNLPFFENYTAGGPHTVRGFRENTLGPFDSKGRPLGGNLKLVGNAELILPVPFAEKIRSFRLSTFLDVGNVYVINQQFETPPELCYPTDNDCYPDGFQISKLRYSTG